MQVTQGYVLVSCLAIDIGIDVCVVKCDGKQPCSHCLRRKGEVCHFTPTTKKPRIEIAGIDKDAALYKLNYGSTQAQRQPVVLHGQTQSTRGHSTGDDDEMTVVSRESRLMQDPQGKLMFVGDSAPLSYLQSVRRFITTLIASDGFAQTGSDVLLEQNDASSTSFGVDKASISLTAYLVDAALAAFCVSTSGLIDIGDFQELRQRFKGWPGSNDAEDMFSAVNYLIVAIGWQASDSQLGTKCYVRGKAIALRQAFDTSPLAAEVFMLMSLYMLRNSQPNGSFLWFGLAARATYSIGMHRTEVNAKLGKDAHRHRERL